MSKPVLLALLAFSALQGKLVDDYLTIAQEYFSNKEFERSAIYFKRVLDAEPNNTQALFGVGNTSFCVGDYSAAYNQYSQLLERGNQSWSLFVNASKALSNLGRYDECLYWLEKAAELDPQNQKTQDQLRSLYMLNGDFDTIARRWPFEQTPWNNLAVAGKRILLKFNFSAGFRFGDILLQIRHAQKLKKAGAIVIIQTDKAVVPLLSNCPYIDTIVTTQQPLPDYDEQYFVNRDAECLFAQRALCKPDETPYLFASAHLIEQWKRTLSPNKNFKIGLCWHSSMIRDLKNNLIASNRTIPLELFAPIAQIDGISLYSLQKMDGAQESAHISFYVHDFGDIDSTNGRFMDTAAIMKNLDLVITADTAIAHLAGGLGVRTWMLLPYDCCWQWFRDRSDSPWYPTMTIFRQPMQGDWSSVMEKVCQRLQQTVKHH